MALYYNLANVHALSSDKEFVDEILTLFITEIPQDVEQIGEGIKQKNYEQTYLYAHKIKPSLHLLGMTIAHEDTLQIESWAKAQGKRKEVEATFTNVNNQVEKAVKEIKKDYNL